MVCGLSHFALVTCNKVLTFRRKKRLVANYLLCKTKPVNCSTLTNPESGKAHKKIHFISILFIIKSQTGGRRPRFVRLS